jgi:alkanesulfonate monooxygenase SsuD/methylene tetrahydromethanopterin reductase-like flavin-dependent oxidoreductase (luciferase family)
VQQPHPPILIGDSGERKTLRRVAQYADACNLALRELAEAGISPALVAPECSWDEARFDAIAAILPDVHAIEPEQG